jgi:hypothetical protein
VLQNRRLHAALPQPQQVAHGVLGARKDNQIRPSQGRRGVYIPQGHRLHPLQGVEVGKVGNAGQADHRNVDEPHLAAAGEPGREGVLVVHVHVQHGHHTQHRLAGQLLQSPQARAENLRVPPELVDDESANQLLLLRLQQLHGAVEGGEHAAPVDVSAQKHRRSGPAGHAHVDEIIGFQVDFRRTARALDDDDVIFLR